MEKKAVSQVLRDMSIGEVQSWPIDRYETVRVLVGRMQLIYAGQGRKYSVKSMPKQLRVDVTRTA